MAACVRTNLAAPAAKLSLLQAWRNTWKGQRPHNSEAVLCDGCRNEGRREGFVRSSSLRFGALRGWAIGMLLEADAIRECEHHGWMQDRADPHARERL
jgi:hypothetical protein